MTMRMEWINAMAGGALIGLAASLMLLLNGRVMGISGILGRALSRKEGPNAWRWSVLIGLLIGGIALRIFRPESFGIQAGASDFLILVAGFLVGLGSALGNGCTSGHGVCGISRLSFRSIVATCVFMLSGALTVLLLRTLGVRP